jgi:predicted RND superfamily exporter protein
VNGPVAPTPITKSFSLADALVALSPVRLEQQPRWVRTGLVRSALTAMRGWMPEFYDTLYGEDPADDQHYFRLMLRVHERQTASQKQELIDRLRSTSERVFPGARVTGYFVLLADLINSILRDQWRTFWVAVLGVGLLMGLAFRDLRLALIALVPNALPILIVLGGMGWISVWCWPDLKINMGTAMIAAVSMGLSIDSTIHYVSAFQRARRAGLEFDEALQTVQQNVGKAMVLSTIALMVGFTVLATSRFIPTVYFGTLVSLAMLGGLIGNLVLLPLLLQLVMRPRTGGDS